MENAPIGWVITGVLLTFARVGKTASIYAPLIKGNWKRVAEIILSNVYARTERSTFCDRGGKSI